MHELSIAINIIEIVNEEAAKAKAKRVTDIELEVGSLSGIEIEALELALEVSVKETIMQHAILKIVRKQAMAHCNSCKSDFSCESLFDPCPTCNGFDYKVFQGQEMIVKSLAIE
ncbi:MAG: hydrogenase maturation nickel metallochaperone HypA [Bacteroidetes bacterium]|nr:hydrogenase maturation nickel metallochaperone HypA [Bacteroidota bacterium]